MDDGQDLQAGPALHPWLVVLALAPGIFLTLADATVMSVAVPLIIRRLESTVISVSWVMNGYNLVLTVLFLTMGRLADRYGHKQLFVLGLAVFTGASFFCARATSIDALIAWRVVQAVGAAAVVPTALALLLQAFPERPAGLRRRPLRGAQLRRGGGGPGARRRAHPALGLAGRVLVQPAGRGPRRRPGAGAGARPAGAAGPRPARLAGRGPGHRRPLLPHAGDHPGQRLGLVFGRRARPHRRRRAPARRLGLVGAARRLPAVRPAPLPRPHLRRRQHRHHDRRHGDDGHLVHARHLHDRDDGLQRAQGRPGDRRIAGRRPRAHAAGRVAHRPARAPAARGGRRPGERRRPVRPRPPGAHRPALGRALAQRPGGRRPRPLAAGAAGRRHERRARRPQGRRRGHAQHGAPARLSARRGDPRRGVRPHHGHSREPLRR